MTVVFLDRDGVINENRPDHVKNWSEFRFLPGVAESVARLTRAQVQVFVITNQAIVNRQGVSPTVVEDVHHRMVREIEGYGGRIVDIAYCPHRPDEACACRKPRPGLIFELAAKHHLDLRDAVLIGDALTDVEAGTAAGCRPILVLTGRGRDQLKLARDGQHRFTVAGDLPAAVDFVLDGMQDQRASFGAVRDHRIGAVGVASRIARLSRLPAVTGAVGGSGGLPA